MTDLVRAACGAVCLLTAAASSVAAAAAGSRQDQIVILGNPAGSQSVSTGSDGRTRAEYSFNDRGRGDHIVATWKLDAAGVLTAFEARGNDYYKVPVTETFRITGGKASWSSRSEHGSTAVAGEAFYVPVNAPPEIFAVLARALLKAPGHRLPLLPAGEATLEKVELPAADASVASGPLGPMTLYAIGGLDFSPDLIWLGSDATTSASVSGWFSVLPAALQPQLAQLTAAQTRWQAGWSARLAREATRVPTGEVLIRNARLFDPRDLSVTPGTSVVVRGVHIVRVAPDADVTAGAGAEVIDAHGRFLMPGLWDNHQHFGDTTGALDIANGVTSARDMANDTDEFLERVARFDAGTELGPRVWKSGIIDGTGPYAGPTKMRIDTAAQGVADVDWYADHGYGQIKIYSSVPPAFVPVIAAEAHARGLRVSGHVPAFMSAQQFVADGADEIQHLNFIELDFLFPEVQETRNMNRFTAVAAHARDFTPDKPQVRDFIAYLVRHHTVLDPTMNVFEGLFCGDPAAVTPGLEAVAPRMPPQVRRGLLSGALTVPKGEEAAYREATPAMLRLLKALYDAGVTIIPGTDSMPGYELHHELDLYVRAGISPAEVLRMDTLTSALVIGANGERGVIAPGKLADLILIDGDPSVRIADLDRIDLVMKGGRLYEPARIEAALGITPARREGL
ncbi:MAG TPA: amidohydrolase family protein [Steroidobacteraceae bacterium]|jgi:imidazolonepropionase-like amidohydrolase|nr:amidohydrolase family protein [Steroidobacteraceae bacterium]